MYNIWCYWSQGENNLPEFPRICLNNWKNILSKKNFKINLISKKKFLDLQNELDENFLNKFTYQQQSDIVRLYLLYIYGGIWMDITTILQKDLSWVIDKFENGYEQVGFYVNYPFLKKTHYLLESWFIAVKNPYNKIILLWKNTFINILKESLNTGKINKSKIWLNTNKESIPFFLHEYLSIHVANLWCVQNNQEYNKYYNSSIFLYNANKTALINPSLDIKSVLFGIGYNINFPLIKFTSFDTKYFKYWPSNKLRNIIKQNNYNIINPLIINLIIFNLIIFTIIITFILLSKKK